jgi:hypothetical protein
MEKVLIKSLNSPVLEVSQNAWEMMSKHQNGTERASLTAPGSNYLEYVAKIYNTKHYFYCLVEFGNKKFNKIKIVHDS